MTRRNLKPLRCDLDANGSESVHRAVQLAQTFAEEHSLTHAQTAKFAVLVEEAVTNLYDHGEALVGFRGWLELEETADGARIRLGDNGQPFDPREVEPSAGPNLHRGGGAGLALIRAWAEIVDYHSEGGLNLLELKMRN